MSKKKLELKSTATPEELAAHLTALAQSFGRGKVVLEQGGRFISLEPAGPTELEIQAEQKKGRSKLTIEISWHAPAAAASVEALKISSEEPEAVEEPEEDGEEEGSDELAFGGTSEE